MSEKQTRAEGYRTRAVELRVIAEVIKSPENKARLFKIADYYEHLADQIERMGLYNGPGSKNPKLQPHRQKVPQK